MSKPREADGAGEDFKLDLPLPWRMARTDPKTHVTWSVFEVHLKCIETFSTWLNSFAFQVQLPVQLLLPSASEWSRSLCLRLLRDLCRRARFWRKHHDRLRHRYEIGHAAGPSRGPKSPGRAQEKNMLHLFNNKWTVWAGGRGNVFLDGWQDRVPAEHPTRPRGEAAFQHVRLGDLWSSNCCGASSVDHHDFSSLAPLLWSRQTVILCCNWWSRKAAEFFSESCLRLVLAS